MTKEDSLAAARDAIGECQSSDRAMQPSKHAAELEQKAPVLAAALRQSNISAVAEAYEQKDAEAQRNQDAFNRAANRANFSVLLAAIFSASLLVAPLIAPKQETKSPNVANAQSANAAATSPGDQGKVWLAILGALGVISGALGSMWMYRAREGKYLGNWLAARAGAEDLRCQYFEGVTGLELTGAEGQIPPL